MRSDYYSTLNSEHNWEDLYIQSKCHQPFTSIDNHNYMRGEVRFLCQMLHCGSASATQTVSVVGT